MTWEGEPWPSSTDRDAELAGSRGKKELRAKDTEEERREGGKEADDWNREGRVLPYSRPVVSVCYIIICLSGLNVKLGYWRGENVTVTSRIFIEKQNRLRLFDCKDEI